MMSDKEETFMQIAYVLNGITYLPHYRNPSVFVGPGYPRFILQRYSDTDMFNAGAQQGKLPLWKRGTYGVVTDQKP
jgi:hypothetical protein